MKVSKKKCKKQKIKYKYQDKNLKNKKNKKKDKNLKNLKKQKI